MQYHFAGFININMTYVQWILYVLLIVVVVILIFLLLKLYAIVNRAEDVLRELEEALMALNNDLPVILENLREATEEARETTRMTKMALKKAKDQVLWMNMLKEAVGVLTQLRKKRRKKDE